MSLALQNEPNPRSARLSVLVNSAEAGEIAHRAATAGLSVSAYLREKALAAGPSREEQEALAIFDRLLDEMTARVDQTNASLEAALTRIETPAAGL